MRKHLIHAGEAEFRLGSEDLREEDREVDLVRPEGPYVVWCEA
jgi:hypothetical protein